MTTSTMIVWSWSRYWRDRAVIALFSFVVSSVHSTHGSPLSPARSFVLLQDQLTDLFHSCFNVPQSLIHCVNSVFHDVSGGSYHT
ncbi:hypothetical protein A2U01_0078810, partial [Trifolium medium]|nr:hypothetical protein [Trifolium medium]